MAPTNIRKHLEKKGRNERTQIQIMSYEESKKEMGEMRKVEEIKNK